jgi:NhaP-type Na+/H+ or K+/H+ antiporter
MAFLFKFIVGFSAFCLIGLICFWVYLYLDKKLEKKPFGDFLVYLVTFVLAFGLAIITAPLMGYGENPLEILFK